jgi:hypothetical protein
MADYAEGITNAVALQKALLLSAINVTELYGPVQMR